MLVFGIWWLEGEGGFGEGTVSVAKIESISASIASRFFTRSSAF